ncbi:hypothetical protein [Craterilacuibacter sp. RT1T]|uniref:COG4315 family predicted lipoprotein n=1 Tax=Craterilacuibacter sp. RT1T TaxID=2942211 RepID=UPI0020BDEB42|nr:hypothetical protein [Craterilacuibacter sp. RT1T]MCL6264827.1 hypothetical protein [Craterilacuibacter sp. RT1T]
MKTRLLLISLLLAGSVEAAPPKTAAGVLTDGQGMTLYVFDKDVPASAKSVCNGPCAANWPPLLVVADDVPSGDFSAVVREDGNRQWAYKGRPLYRWVQDQKPGDTSGDGVNQVWHSAKP